MIGNGYGNSMFLATHGILARGGGVVPSLLLDTYPNAAVAYSLRKLRTAYTGSAIRVRRSVDNAEQDIAFVGNDLDTTTMLDFVGYNLLTYSEDATQTAWVKLNGTVTADATTAPDSTTTADKFIENVVNGTHSIKRTFTSLIVGEQYNASMYIKKAERTKVQIRSNIGGSNQTFDLDLTTGTVTNNQFSNTPVISNEGNDWWRVSIQITSGTTSAANGFEVYLSNGTTISYAGDGVSGAYVWGSQISQTSSIKTYQKTVATAGGNGFVTTWYDQSGNGKNANQSTASLQATIVSNGNTIYVNNKVAAQFTNDYYSLSANVTPTSQFITANVIQRPSGGTFATWGNRSSNQRPHLFSWNTDNNINCSPYSLGSIITITNSSYGGQSIVTTKRIVGNVIQGSLNGVQYTPLSSQSNQSAVDVLGGLNNVAASTGHLQETIWWNQNYSSLELNISDTINNYYGIY